MSLTKKEFMMAVKLCSDVAVQRGLPNMRLRAAKNFHSKGKVCLWVVGGCCTVGRPIASHTKGPGFESSHLQFFIKSIYLLFNVEKTKKVKKRPRMTHF